MKHLPETQYTCGACLFSGSVSDMTIKLLSVMYRSKHDNIQAFHQIKCPKCDNQVTIIFETMEGTIPK